MADDKKAKQREQVGKMEQLQDLILDDFIAILKDHTASATDRATIVRFCQSNGWTLDPSQLPAELKALLTSTKRFDTDLSPEETGERILKAI